MYTDKKITKEDTWRPADLRRHIREEERGGDDARRRDGYDRRYRGGESAERRHRDQEKESRREKNRLRERESTGRERRDEGRRDRRKEGSQDRRAERGNEREKTRERERFVDVRKYGDDYRENKETRRDLEEKHDRERDKERHRDKEKERVRDRDRHREEDRSKRRDDVNKERKREEQDRELRNDGERRRHKESREGRGAQIEQHHREEKDQHRERHQNEYEDTRNAKEERQRDMKHLEQKGDREYKEEHRKRKEEREQRHRERGHHEEKQKPDSEYREHRGEEIRHHRADRELAERDRPKDRRYKEGEDPENKHRERRHKHEADVERKHKERKHREEDDHRDKRSSSGKSHERNVEVDLVSEQWIPAVKHEADTEEPQVVNDEDLADQDYEDDFEDYEEDFEELNESTNEDEDEKEPLHPQAGEAKEELSAQRRKEIEAIRRAMDEENERIGTTKSRQSTSREEEERPKWSRDTEKIQSRASQRGKFIDFVAAKQREVSKKVASKQKKRSTELLRLIDLDFSMTFSLLDLPPVNEYDMYIRNFGNANTKQAYVQCNEDNTDRDIQTEEIEMSEKWTQHPPERSGACGDPNLSKEARDKQRSEMNYDSQRLASFLRSASQVMVVLLEEDQAERKSLEKLSTQSDTLSFSDGSLQLITELPFLYDRQISMLHFSQVQKHTMLSVHMPTTKPSAKHLDSCTIICIWNIWEPSRPQKILVYESEIQCCCFSPGKVTLVFAGTSVGSVVLWDLREQSSNHYSLKMGEEEWTFRQPTFSTDAVLAASGHLSSVTSVEVVPSALAGELRADVPLLASEEESSGLSFQLASLDESGVLNFWVVVELPKGNEAGSPTDLGLRPGGKVKLLHSSSVLAAESLRGSPRDVVKTGPLHTLLLKFLPTDSNHFFIGTNMGLVHHGTSHGLKAPPKFYRFQEVEVQPVDVTSIHFSPFRPHLFLVGCGNGSIRLHAVSHEQPVAQWKNSTAGEPVVSLQWAQTRATVFCVLDAACNLHIWDLLKDDTQPVVTERMSADRVTDMALFGQSGKQNTYSGVALAHESGKIEMQYFKRSLTVSSTAEEEKLLERMTTEAF
ncbi:cytoplasmic dynein 2 intermediate chain 1 isoform X2 [Simochromis diagramma]|uniref:cytoplasmic dynein 2 intermediate chain 1 isoform X2 n=1 Tax=Simochromis diagramma TaxID=43689 RepID=UPI001A7F05AA|nr:cytoplasmic dynein 2 intermediate chain 1 isoform X2 [Simochromis diagramma]